MAQIGETFDKVPPQNLEMEQSLLGSLLIDKDAIIKIADIITVDDFYKDSHGVIFEAMKGLYEKREPIDLISLGSKLDDNDKLEAIGGRSYLTSLAKMNFIFIYINNVNIIISNIFFKKFFLLNFLFLQPIIGFL